MLPSISAGADESNIDARSQLVRIIFDLNFRLCISHPRANATHPHHPRRRQIQNPHAASPRLQNLFDAHPLSLPTYQLSDLRLSAQRLISQGDLVGLGDNDDKLAGRWGRFGVVLSFVPATPSAGSLASELVRVRVRWHLGLSWKSFMPF
ncbi:hypothetical protein DENSPDRAFT_629804 [Dentipellis sp. KUC8613]|nr:hypothetical protein DENSPDRAFT_629804 [Dentipellis sp. KUC8613]